MKIEEFKQAKELLSKIGDINKELKIWEKELTSPAKMAYQQAWNNFHAVEMRSLINHGLFDSFRNSAINDLVMQRMVLEEEMRLIGCSVVKHD